MSQLRVTALTSPQFGPIDLCVDQGKCVCLSGSSGAGKTLLLRAIADLDVHEGDVWLDDQESRSMSGPRWRRYIGLLLAESFWWYDIVAPHFSSTDVEQLKILGFDSSVMSQPVARLSTGERQRLALLRLLENQPKILLLDEPTASLDPLNVGRVESLIEKYRNQHKTAVLWVSHDSDQIKRVSTGQLTIEHGQLTGESSW